ncbi:MAG: alkaline phosphatase family protein [Prevotella sp.]|nr:alkaline phosphatase family protein [Prevotella sp.]MDD7046197.1 alkaline phosphatase family protein [Prevotella sp.]MDY5545925.1 alkaline phosphatase family protein [Prevotella sp.]
MNRYVTAALVAITATATQAQTLNPAPKLVVNITVDQLRSDYIEAFAPLYTENGFRKLLKQGKIFENVSYAFTPIDRASAIATIQTGATPYYNGIVGEKWLDRNTLQPITCDSDPKFQYSPNHIVSSTIGDELKIATEGGALVYAIAPFRNAAILSAGHAADGAIWIDEDGKWTTSTYYSKDLPKWAKVLNETNPPKSLRTNDFIAINSSITDMALQCFRNTSMGTDSRPDLLEVTYYAGNVKNDKTTQWQSQLQQTYVSLDKNIGKLITTIEQNLGRQNVVFVVTSTGYSDEEEKQDYAKYRIPTGTFYINRTANLLNIYLGAIYGQGRYVNTYFHNQLYLNDKLIEQKRLSMSDVLKRCQAFLIQLSGVRDCFTSDLLLTSRSNDLETIRNGYMPNVNGDIVIEVTPGWQLLNEDNQETFTARASFVPFPIIIYGADVRAERISTPVTVDRLAPTIAKTIRIRAPNACKAAPLY